MVSASSNSDAIRPSVCHRHPADAWPTAGDYDEAIEALQLARSQLRPDGNCCSVCEDSGHQAFECHHNPLLLARKWTAARGVWTCWHCGFTATSDAEATEHFGFNDEASPACLKAEAATQADLAMLVARLAHRLRRSSPGDSLAADALGFLRRHSMQGAVLRSVSSDSISCT